MTDQAQKDTNTAPSHSQMQAKKETAEQWSLEARKGRGRVYRGQMTGTKINLHKRNKFQHSTAKQGDYSLQVYKRLGERSKALNTKN